MDSSFTVRSRAGAQKSYAPRDPVAVRQAVETDLDASKTVAASGDGAGKQSDHGKHGDPHPDHPAHDVVVDPESRAVIYRERDVRTAEGEHPDQALMRLRAYRPSPASAETAPDGEPHADIEA